MSAPSLSIRHGRVRVSLALGARHCSNVFIRMTCRRCFRVVLSDVATCRSNASPRDPRPCALRSGHGSMRRLAVGSGRFVSNNQASCSSRRSHLLRLEIAIDCNRLALDVRSRSIVPCAGMLSRPLAHCEVNSTPQCHTCDGLTAGGCDALRRKDRVGAAQCCSSSFWASTLSQRKRTERRCVRARRRSGAAPACRRASLLMS